MNIFFLDQDPYMAAKHQHDKLLVKMVLETAQLLCTTRRYFGDDSVPYKSTHINHPSTKWVRESKANYMWLLVHFKALLEEYTYRYYKVHKCYGLLLTLARDLEGIPDIGPTPIALAMPEEYKVDCPYQSYRNYYLAKKIEGRFWTNRKRDELDNWLTGSLTDEQFKLNLKIGELHGSQHTTKS